LNSRRIGDIIRDDKKQPVFKIPIVKPIRQLMEEKQEEKPKPNFYQKNPLKM
jgi:hypothetical protein